MRKIAIDMGITLNELSKIAETDSSIDISIDNEVKKAGEMSQVVIDSRLAFHWIPESFKIYLELEPKVAKERILKIKKRHLSRGGRQVAHPAARTADTGRGRG